jgi:hypothetical protein
MGHTRSPPRVPSPSRTSRAGRGPDRGDSAPLPQAAGAPRACAPLPQQQQTASITSRISALTASRGLSAVQAANPGMSFVEVVNRAIYHVVEHPKTRLPNRGLTTGTTGCPACSTSPSSAVSLCVGGSAAGRSSGPRDGRALGAVIPQAFDSAAMETV